MLDDNDRNMKNRRTYFGFPFEHVARTERLYVRLSRFQKAQLEIDARQAGYPIAEYARARLLGKRLPAKADKRAIAQLSKSLGLVKHFRRKGAITENDLKKFEEKYTVAIQAINAGMRSRKKTLDELSRMPPLTLDKEKLDARLQIRVSKQEHAQIKARAQSLFKGVALKKSELFRLLVLNRHISSSANLDVIDEIIDCGRLLNIRFAKAMKKNATAALLKDTAFRSQLSLLFKLLQRARRTT